MDKEGRISSDSTEELEESLSRFVLLSTNIPSDVLLALSVAAYLQCNNPHRVADVMGVGINADYFATNHSDDHENCVYTELCKLFDAAFENRDVMKTPICLNFKV